MLPLLKAVYFLCVDMFGQEAFIVAFVILFILSSFFYQKQIPLQVFFDFCC